MLQIYVVQTNINAHYEFVKTLGHGASGQVYLGQRKQPIRES